jgi:hypothetical protein
MTTKTTKTTKTTDRQNSMSEYGLAALMTRSRSKSMPVPAPVNIESYDVLRNNEPATVWGYWPA